MMRAGSIWRLLVPLLLIGCDGWHVVGSDDRSLGSDGQPPRKDGTCNQGLTPCAGVCRDLQTDAANCGGCGTACAQAQTCVQGQCSPPACAQGTTFCNRGCVDLQTDATNCGRCGNACPNQQVCTQGACAPAGCAVGLTACNDVCVDLRTDAANCGGCGTACAASEVCAQGACVCGPGLTACNKVCVNLDTDALNCGQCGTACAQREVCAQGACLGCVVGALTLIPSPVNVPVGLSVRVTFRNPTACQLNVLDIFATGPDAPDFILTPQFSPPFAINAGGSFYIDVRASQVNRRATLVVRTEWGDVSVALM